MSECSLIIDLSDTIITVDGIIFVGYQFFVSPAKHRDHFVRRLSGCPSACLSHFLGSDV